MDLSCARCHQNFVIEPEDEIFLKKLEVPHPTQCPDCRNQRRMVFRNDRNFYMRSCDLCQKPMVSICSPEKSFPIYCRDCYMSDRFDPLAHGRDFDFNRPFFEQFEEMRAQVPRIAIYNTMSENSDYTVHSSKNKNCYMGSSLVDCENVLYSDFVFTCKDSVDLYSCEQMEKSYFCAQSEQCYESAYLENCMGVNFSYLCFDCRNSNNLLGCVGLRRKEFMILNQPCSREEFASTLLRLKSDLEFKRQFEAQYQALRLKIPVKSAWDKNCENCSGNYIRNSKNAQHVYNVMEVEDGRHIYEGNHLKDCMDVTRVAPGEMLYEVKAGVDIKFSQFCNLCYQSSNLQYCDNSQNSHDSFGCMGLKSHRYCILNKQYSPEEYAVLRGRIVEHMKKTGEYGEFFPVGLSVYGYNETKAQEFYPLAKEQALTQGFKWKDPDEKQYRPGTPEVPACVQCGKNYKIVPQEREFYAANGHPVPDHCSDCRHLARLAWQNPRRLYDRSCAKCAVAIRTTYAPDRPEIVYCEACYLGAIA